MGKPIAQHQLIQAKLADMETECEAARGLLYRFGQMVDDGVDGAELTKASAMAKLKCGDVAMAVTTDAVQILGGYGYIKEYPVERFMRDAKITQIYEGTQEIQRLVIAREMVKESGPSCSPASPSLGLDLVDLLLGLLAELDDVALLEEHVLERARHFSFRRRRNSRLIAKCLNSSCWAFSMIARASSFFSTEIRCSYQPIASASSWSDVIMRANVRTSSLSSSGGSWY